MPPVYLTIDIDWAPDYMIEFMAHQLIKNGTKATWFVTHETGVLKLLRQHPDLFELGIHPNFHKGSDHGSTLSEVIEHCMKLVPEAVAMRAHDLFLPTSFLRYIAINTPIKCDVSILLPYAQHVESYTLNFEGQHILRIPYIWEDDVESMLSFDSRWAIEEVEQVASKNLSPFIINLHPVWVFLNDSCGNAYKKLKEESPRIQEASEAFATSLICENKSGAGTMFRSFIDSAESRKNSLMISEFSTQMRTR